MSARYVPEERPVKIQEALNGIGSWLLNVVKAEDGWTELVLEIKPLAAATHVRIIERREGEEFIGSTGPLMNDSRVLPEIQKLQHATYDENEGSWVSAAITIAAANWPTPDYQIGAVYNRMKEPAAWTEDDRLSADDLNFHLQEFPRHDFFVPGWFTDVIEGRRAFADGSAAGVPALVTNDEAPNPYLISALQGVVPGERTDQGVLNVLRSSLGGDVLVDVLADAAGEAGAATPSYRLLELANGAKALCLFSSLESYEKFYEQQKIEAEPNLVREIALKVYVDFMTDPDLALVVVDPGTAGETFIEKAQVGWVLTTPSNDALKRALMAGDKSLLLTSLTSPSAFLLVGVRPETGEPIFVETEDGQETTTMLVFTSAAEVAATGLELGIRSGTAGEVLNLLDEYGADSIQVNSLEPSVLLSAEQVSDIRARIEAVAANLQAQPDAGQDA